MRSSTLTFALGVALMSGGCGNEEWQAPTPIPSPSEVPAEIWDLTATLRAVTGPDCLTGSQVLGSSSDWLLEVRRDGSAIGFLVFYGPDDDLLELVGSLQGEEFTANSTMGPRGALLCDDVSVPYVFESHVAGEFSADGRELTARETWTYRLDGLDPLVLSFDWTATR
jgi:hypothetical protein